MGYAAIFQHAAQLKWFLVEIDLRHAAQGRLREAGKQGTNQESSGYPKQREEHTQPRANMTDATMRIAYTFPIHNVHDKQIQTLEPNHS